RLLVPIEATDDIVPGTAGLGYQAQLLHEGLVGRVIEVERGVTGIATVVVWTASCIVLLARRDIDDIVVPVIVVRARRRHCREAGVDRDSDRPDVQGPIQRLLRDQLPGRIQRAPDGIAGTVVEGNI